MLNRITKREGGASATADGSALLSSLPTEESFFDLLRQTDKFSGDLRVMSGKSVTFVASNLKTDKDMPQLFTLFGLRFMFYSRSTSGRFARQRTTMSLSTCMW